MAKGANDLLGLVALRPHKTNTPSSSCFPWSTVGSISSMSLVHLGGVGVGWLCQGLMR